MSATRYDRDRDPSRGKEVLADLAAWNRANGEDNSEQLQRLRRNLRRARKAELTARQAEMLHMYYDLGLTMTQVAHELGVNKSSVSRTIARGRGRLRRCLQYSF